MGFEHIIIELLIGQTPAEICRRQRSYTVVIETPVLLQVWQGQDVVKTARKMMGETNPADSLPGTIRGDYCVEVSRSEGNRPLDFYYLFKDLI